MTPRVLRLTAIRAVLHISGIALMFLSLRYLPLADAIAIAFVMPFIMLILGHFVLGEEVGHRRILACCVGFVGTLAGDAAEFCRGRLARHPAAWSGGDLRAVHAGDAAGGERDGPARAASGLGRDRHLDAGSRVDRRSRGPGCRAGGDDARRMDLGAGSGDGCAWNVGTSLDDMVAAACTVRHPCADAIP